MAMDNVPHLFTVTTLRFTASLCRSLRSPSQQGFSLSAQKRLDELLVNGSSLQSNRHHDQYRWARSRLIEIFQRQVPCSIPSVLLGSSHNIVYTPALVRNSAQLRLSVVDYMSIKCMLFNKTFGNLAEYQDIYTAASDELDTCVAKHLLQDPDMSDMSRSAIFHIHAQVRSLVT